MFPHKLENWLVINVSTWNTHQLKDSDCYIGLNICCHKKSTSNKILKLFKHYAKKILIHFERFNLYSISSLAIMDWS